MTFIGSENNISSKFIEDNFKKEYTYHEFNQGIVKIGYNKIFLNMLTNKYRFSYKKSMEKNPNISLLAGSNDFISMNFFEQIIQSYDLNKKQIFGIDNYYNGCNKTALDLYDGQNFLKNLHWTTGKSNYNKRQKYKYIGGIIGFNDKLYKYQYNYLMSHIITYDEGRIEYCTTAIPDVVKFTSKDVFFINIKTSSNSEITKFDILKKKTSKEYLNYSIFNDKFKNRFINEYKDFLLLYKNNNT